MIREIETYNQYDIDLKDRNSGQIRTLCVKCSHERKKKTDPCLAVNIDKATFYCHNCEWTGSLHKYKRKVEKTYIKPKKINSTRLSDKLVDWFKNRGISQWVLNDMKISEGKEYMPQENKELNTVQFNYFLNGEIINIKYRDAKKNFKLFKDAELVLYNIDSLIDAEYVIICEGEIDCLSFIECGLKNVVSVPNGANKNLEYLNEYVEYFDNVDKIYLATDNDEKGVNLRIELARRLGVEKCFIIEFNECKDANEYLTTHGKLDLEQLFYKAKEFPISGVFTVNNLSDQLDTLYSEGLKRGMSCGFHPIDKHISFELGRVYTFVGIPSHGKTYLVDNIICKLNILEDLKFGLFSPENYPITIHMSALIEKIVGKLFSGDTKMSPDEYKKCKEHVDKNYFWIMPEDETFTLDNILEKAKYLIKKYGIHCLVIDPFNKIEHQIGSGMNETTYIGKVLDKILNFAHQNRIMIFLVVHPTKMRKQKDSMMYEVPTLYDCMGSSNFYNKAEFGISVYRNFQTENIEIYFQKIKFKHLGEMGDVEMKFNINNGRFTEIDNFTEIGKWDNSNWLVKKGIETTEIKIEDEEVPF